MNDTNVSLRELVIEQVISDLETDLDNLDSVWANQPKLVIKYTAKQAESERICAEEKDRIEGLEAALYNVVRTARNMNGTKSSEAAIEAMVKQIERHYSGSDTELSLKNSFMDELPEKVAVIARTLAKVRNNYNHTKEMTDIYKGAVDALRHRRDMVVQASKKAILDYEILGAGTFAGRNNTNLKK
ncbi:hypothetical protein [Xenorhabdus szentirmaii]|uniref:Uncharacterized protein n=1 Tax=Xenorhabdus szentirmaii DSM 16338 TaxID=1427518 RepID=W1ITB2_9GAMM|nr:hypothetical protein [Xenorhabdus szentirmaii]PHM30588.1 hypothetical protein Xsze_04179 [Xenorhabdus szentirmaii DSM 16338]CDL81063.1 conserved hypothetical protein [Xenorhabdus szentirmaii DSM 16338]